MSVLFYLISLTDALASALLHTHATHMKSHKHCASEGSGKARHSDEVQSKNTCFPGPRRCLSALLPPNKCRQKGAAQCGGFPPWQNTLTCENKVCGLKLKPLRSVSLLDKILQSSCALRYFHTFVRAADLRELARREGKAESQSQRRVKGPEPDIFFFSATVDYIGCCFLTGDFTVYQADTLQRRTSCAPPLLPLEVTGTDNNRLCMICLCLCSLSTSAGHTVNLVSSSTAWKLRGWLGLTFTYPDSFLLQR